MTAEAVCTDGQMLSADGISVNEHRYLRSINFEQSQPCQLAAFDNGQPDLLSLPATDSSAADGMMRDFFDRSFAPAVLENNCQPAILLGMDADLFDLSTNPNIFDTYSLPSELFDDRLENESWMPNPMVQEPEEIQIDTPPNNARRRRDYTKQEKEAFEQWITTNPKPDKNQKMAYARLHGLTESQLQNLINNRRRRKTTLETSKVLESDGAVTSLAPQGDSELLSQPGPSFNLKETIMSIGTIKTRDNLNLTTDCPIFEFDDAVEINGRICQGEDCHMDVETASLPVSNSNLLQVLSKKPSYSSIEEYLKSPDEAVPFESIRRASAESHRPDLSVIVPLLPSPPPESTHPASIDSNDPRPTQPNSFFSPPRNWAMNFLSVPGARSRQNSLDSTDGLDTASSFGSIDSFAASLASSDYAGSFASSMSRNSRIRTKKIRRQRHMSKRIEGFSCSFCTKWFKVREDMVDHETKVHCLPQTFPCTRCQETFDSTDAWENHENNFHCQPHMTWFCMLDGEMDVHHCLFCSELAPSREHYEEAHDLHPCSLTLELRTFSTRYEVTQHLVNCHQMTDDEVSLIKDGLDIWSLKLDMTHRSGLWRCGYCEEIGADWDDRLIHIKSHWHYGGPRMTKIHPWLDRRAKLDMISPRYLDQLHRGETITNRPFYLHFQGLQFYEAAMKHRAKWKGGGVPFGDDDSDVENLAVVSNANYATAFFSQLASRTKMFLSFARAKRQGGRRGRIETT